MSRQEIFMNIEKVIADISKITSYLAMLLINFNRINTAENIFDTFLYIIIGYINSSCQVYAFPEFFSPKFLHFESIFLLNKYLLLCYKRLKM